MRTREFGSERLPRPPVSCLVFTLNEEANLPRCLDSLAWSDDVVVVDSFSSDRTREIAEASGAHFVQRAFSGFGEQRQWALMTVPLKHAWALILDADERVPSEMIDELGSRLAGASERVAAFRVRRRLYMWGRWLRYSSLYPTWVVRLVRVGRVRYSNRGHAETQVVDGEIEALESDLLDENLTGMDAWWERHHRYSSQEAQLLFAEPAVPLGALVDADPMKRRAAANAIGRRLPFAPLWYFLYSYLFRLGFLDGADGLRFCLMRSCYVWMTRLKLDELRRASRASRR